MSKYIVEKVENPALLEIADFIIGKTNVILAGGAFRSIFSFDEDGLMSINNLTSSRGAKDFDIFFHSVEDFDYLFNKQSNDSATVWKTSKSTAITVQLPDQSSKSAFHMNNNQIKLDLVNKYFGTPEEILDGFDFTVSQCALYRENNEAYLIYNEDYFNHLKNNVLEYADTPEKSGNIIERMLRYVNYGFVPNEETVKKCLASFCQSYENLRDVNVDELLSNTDFQKYHQKGLVEAERIRVKGVDTQTQRRGQQKAMFKRQLQLQNEWMSFIYFLLNYWHSTVEVNTYFVASFSSKYAASFNISKLLEQMSKGYDYQKVDEECIKLTGDFGFALRIDEEDESRWVYSSYSLMNLLGYLHKEKDALGIEKIQSFLRILFSYRFVPQSKKNFVQCIDCGSNIHDRTCVCDHNERLLEMESDVILRVLQNRSNDDQWMDDCLDFFSQIHDSQVDLIPTLFEWHSALDNNLFDPEIPPSLMFTLMIDENYNGDYGG